MIKVRFISDLFNLMYPDLCIVCGENLIRNESCICFICLHELPKTTYHLSQNNDVEKRFWGKVPVFRGIAFFIYQKGSKFQLILQELKYNGNKEIGERLGKYAASELTSDSDFQSIDVIIPVPLHPVKHRERGYNQSEWIAKGLASILACPIDSTTLQRTKQNESQTRKNVYERFRNVEGVFELSDCTTLTGKHILLVDDVLTTGSTLEACIHTLMEVPDITISIFVLAIAKN